MKKNSFLFDEIEDACAAIGASPTTWLKSQGFSSSTSTALKTGVRPTIETMKILIEKFGGGKIGLRLIKAYLMDEIDRLNASQADFSVELAEDAELSDSPEVLNEDLRIIQQFMKHRAIRRSMHGLAILLKRSEWAQEDGLYVDDSDTVAQAEQDAVMHRLSATKKRSKQQNERTA